MDKLQAPQPTNCIRQLPQPGATMSLMLLREGGQFTPICLLPQPEAPTYSASLASTKPCSDRLKIGNHLKLMNTHTVHGPPVGQANSLVGPFLLICHIKSLAPLEIPPKCGQSTASVSSISKLWSKVLIHFRLYQDSTLFPDS